MTTAIALSAQLNDNKISRLVSKACKLLTDTEGKVGSSINFIANDANVTTTLWGFNSSRTNLVVEVAINKVVIEKLHFVRPHGGDMFSQKHKCGFAFLYKLKTGQQFAK
ncbi:hypothetical protein OBP_038 [Pseudomonas phage OBP]|uniref:hypothetical protein n=1 Tax=Pseudomonas phage OBP TaxID=1124849 RepID=UPI000240D623|nr:hypothetical protein OBP_038 [Pseudomonas phage OBP]AEV89475.1 hypothetical protein OBP_038 [Pseudomonas phage OBP]